MAREATATQRVVKTLWNHDEIVVWSDEQLIRQFVSRTDEAAEAAFATLIERHGAIVHRVCLDILRGRDEAQDAAQAVFLVLARRARSIRKPESLGPSLPLPRIEVTTGARFASHRFGPATRPSEFGLQTPPSIRKKDRSGRGFAAPGIENAFEAPAVDVEREQDLVDVVHGHVIDEGPLNDVEILAPVFQVVDNRVDQWRSPEGCS